VAQHIQAEKRNRQSKRRALRNKMIKTGVRSVIKKLELALASAKPAEVQALLKLAISRLDRANSKGVMKRRTSSRAISRLARKAAAAKK
jgi:small subunit ribosomal protein S20